MLCRRLPVAILLVAASLLGGCGAPEVSVSGNVEKAEEIQTFTFSTEPAWAARSDALMVKAALALGEPVPTTHEEISQLEVEQLRRYRAVVQAQIDLLSALPPEEAAQRVRDGALEHGLLDDLLTLRQALVEGSQGLSEGMGARAGVPSTAARLLEDAQVNAIKGSMAMEEPLRRAETLLSDPAVVLDEEQRNAVLKEIVDLAAAVFRLQGDRLRSTSIVSSYLSEEVRGQLFSHANFSTWLGLTPDLGAL